MILKRFMFIMWAATFVTSQAFAAEHKIIEASKKCVVSIKARAVYAAYNDADTNFGTGFIVDKKNGLILTNSHISGVDKVAVYDITLHNGRELKGKLVYYDPWHDFAFLKVDPIQLAQEEDIPTIKFNVDGVKTGVDVYIIGKNENKHFSVQTGSIANPYEVSGFLATQAFRISLNAQGGASGSPIFNMAGEVIGLLHASNQLTSAYALPIQYAQDALVLLQKQQTPPRKGVGIVVDYFSLDEASRFYKFPVGIARDYNKKYPESFNRALRIRSILPGTPAEGVFEVGDIVLAVNDVEIGPNLYQLDKVVNDAKGKQVSYKIIRMGTEQILKLPTYDLDHRKINKMVSFAGAIFYEIDDALIRRTGVKGCNKVFVTNVRAGSSLYEKLPILPNTSKTVVCIVNIDGKEIKNLQDLIDVIPSLVKKLDFYIVYKNYGVEFGYDNRAFFTQTPQIQQVTYSRYDGVPETFTFDNKTLDWNVQMVGETAIEQHGSVTEKKK